MTKEILSNTFYLNINKESSSNPPSYIEKEILSNSFNININKIPNRPPVIRDLDCSLSDRNCTITFNIHDEDGDRMDVYLTRNGTEELILSNQLSGSKTITLYNLPNGVTTLSLRVSDGSLDCRSETISIEIKEVVQNRPPIITNLKHSLSGKNCTITFNIHDEDNDKMNVYLTRNNQEEMVLSNQSSGNKTITVNNLSVGSHIMSLRVSDGKLNTYSDTFRVTVEEEIINNPPTISNIQVNKTNYAGVYELEFEIQDVDNDKMDVYLKVGDSNYEPILVNQSNGVKQYKGQGLSAGNHTCFIKVSDGKQEVVSNSFNIRIPQASNDSIFESIELITPTTIKANTPTRVAIKLKSKANIDKKTIHPKIKDIGNKVKIYNAQWEKGNVLTDWRESVSEISDKTSSIKVGLENITSTVETIQGDYVTSSQIEQLDNSWTAKFKDGYHEGITSIDKDGITVTSNGVKSKTSMSANGFKITKTDTGEDVFKVNADGTLYMKGSVTVTSGNAKDMVDRVVGWTYSGTTEINGGNIRTGTLSASKITAGTLDASKVNVTNLNASNIKSGKLSANYIDATNLSVKGELLSGQINGVGGIKFAQGAVISSYDSHVSGYKGIQISAPSIKLGDKVDIYSPTLISTVTGKSSTSSTSSSWTMSNSGGLNCSTVNTTGTTTVGGTLNVRNNMINGMNNLQIGRGSVNIPVFGTNYTYDYIKGGASRIAFADSGPIHFLYNGSRSSFIAGGTVYLPHAGNTNCDHFRLGAGIMASPSSGSFHFLTANGNTSPLYAGVLYSATTLSLKEPMVMSNNSVFDKINSINVIETKNGLRLHNPISMVDAIDESSEVVKTVYNEEKDEIKTSIDYTSAISTLWKAVQELKQENDELKEIIKSLCPKESDFFKDATDC